jgi:hypothetical protein
MSDPNIKKSLQENPGSTMRGIAHGAAAYQNVNTALRAATSSAPSVGKAVAKGFAKRAGPLAVAGAAIDVANLATSKKARAAAKNAVEEDAKLSPPIRMVKAALNPINTGYGIMAQAKEMIDSGNAAKKSQKQLDAMMQERKNRNQKLKMVSSPVYRR